MLVKTYVNNVIISINLMIGKKDDLMEIFSKLTKQILNVTTIIKSLIQSNKYNHSQIPFIRLRSNIIPHNKYHI